MIHIAVYCEFFGEKEEHQFILPKNIFPISDLSVRDKNKTASIKKCMDRARDEVLTRESIIEV